MAQRRLTWIAADLRQSMAHDVPVTVRTVVGRSMSGMVTRLRIDPDRNPYTKDSAVRSNLIVTIAGEDVLVEDIEDLRLGS